MLISKQNNHVNFHLLYIIKKNSLGKMIFI